MTLASWIFVLYSFVLKNVVKDKFKHDNGYWHQNYDDIQVSEKYIPKFY